MKELDVNAPCEADFRCKSDFCYKDKCADGISPTIKVSKTVAEQGEEVEVTISLVNELNEEIQAQLILEPGSGATVTRVDGADICTSAQCAEYDTVSEVAPESISLMVQGEQTGTVDLKGKIRFMYDGKEHTIPVREEILFTKCGNGIAEAGETSQTCCLDSPCPEGKAFSAFTCNTETKKCERTFNFTLLFGLIGAIAVVGLSVFLGIKFPAYRRKMASEPERKEIRKILELAKNEINLENPPTLQVIMKNLEKNFDLKVQDEECLREEYLEFLEKIRREQKGLQQARDARAETQRLNEPHPRLGRSDDSIASTQMGRFDRKHITKGLIAGGFILIVIMALWTVSHFMQSSLQDDTGNYSDDILCDTQCEGGLCIKGVCVAPILELSSREPTLTAGEENEVTFSIENPFDEEIEVTLTLAVGAGVDISTVLACDEVIGNICKLTRTLAPGATTSILVGVMPKTLEQPVAVQGTVAYAYRDKTLEMSQEMSLEPQVEGAVVEPVDFQVKKTGVKAFLQSTLFAIAVAAVLGTTGLGYVYRNRLEIGARIEDLLNRLKSDREEREKMRESATVPGTPPVEQLERYIENCRKKGFNDDAIEEALLKKGWDRQNVEEWLRK